MKFGKLVAGVLCAVAGITIAAANAEEAPPAYDAALAEKLRADEYGMARYVFVMLKTGPAKIADEARRAELFAGHFQNMRVMAEAGKLVLAGPFIEGGDHRGLFILDVADITEAQALVHNDAAVAAGLLAPEYLNYYGAAALRTLNDTQLKIQKRAVN